MTRNEIIDLIRKAISLARDGGYSYIPFTKDEYDAMYDLLESIEDRPKNNVIVRSDDWRGCQGTCDFDPQPNLTGWI